MVESVLRYSPASRGKNNFHNFKFSLKSSNPKVMIECLPPARRQACQAGPDWELPHPPSVSTEAGEGEDGRIKSAIGIGSLLCDGLGDTIRVSLTEDWPREIPVCRDLIAQIPALTVPAGSSWTRPILLPLAVWPTILSFPAPDTPEIDLGAGVKCGASRPCAWW